MRILKISSYILFFIVFSLVCPLPASSASKEILEKGIPVEITADYLSYDKETETYHARGDVVIVQGGTTLRTDEAMLNTDAGVATARGNVSVVDEGGNALRGESVEMDLKAKTAVVAKGRIFFKQPNVHITGDPLKKTGDQTYDGKNVTFTTCDCEDDESPAWSFHTRTADVTIGEFLTGKNAFFYIKNVPVLYSPYISAPIKRERQTGFLQPKPGYSRLRGFVFDDAFFWAMAGNMDATFFLDLETTRGIGEAVQYRYIRTRKSSGEIYFQHFHENDIDKVREFRKGVNNLSRPKDATSERWGFKLLHNEMLENGVNIRANINLVSDTEYFIDFGKGLERSLESIESNVSVSKSWSAYSIVGQFRYFKNLLVPDNSATLQRLPEISFNGSDQKIFNTPFYFSVESSFTNFYRRDGIDGDRADLHPRVSLPLNPGGYFDLTPSIAPRATFYLVNRDPLGRYVERFLYDATVNMTTTFVRVYNTDLDWLSALRHTIRPRLTYTYIPERVQANLPQFDAIDAIPATNAVTYGLNTTLTGKYYEDWEKKYIDYLYFDLAQTYSINEATRKLTSETDKRRPFSDVTGELIIKPSQRTVLTGKGAYDVNNRRFNTYNISIAATDTRGDSLTIANRFIRNSSNYLEASARARVIDPLDLIYIKRFSFDQRRSLETQYGVEYRHQCYTVLVTYTERPEEKIVFLTFNLKGLGQVAGVRGSLL